MKRFYKEVCAAPDGAGWRVLLDGRPVRTVGGGAQIVPGEALAQALAAEWDAQGDEIDPSGFIFRDMADYAIDGVRPDRAGAIRDLLPYGETDTLCYREDAGHPLRREQDLLWEPILSAAERRWGLVFERIGSVLHQPQPAETMAALEALLVQHDEFALAALRALSGLAASLIIGLSALEDGADHEALWIAANLEEDWQAERWGRDAEAEERRARRHEAFLAAARFVKLARAV